MPAPAPEILTHAQVLLANYDVIFCDVWGVVHNGVAPHETACEALITFRASGGTVILVSNAPVPKRSVQAMLDRVGVPAGIADDIVSSGDIALRHVKEKAYARAFFIGPEDRDAAFFSDVGAERAALAHAEAIICTGLNDDRTEHPDDYRSLLKEAKTFDLPFVCANPDYVVDVGGHRFYCAGAIADLYEQLGGLVYWAGKPHLSAYDTAMTYAQNVRGEPIKKTSTLVIGDAVRTDIEGARRAGLDALFIAGGIHRADVVAGAHIDPDKLANLFSGDAPPARAAMVTLAW